MTRLSPSSTLTSRRGRPALRAVAETATASVGPRIAPRAKAIGVQMPGMTNCATNPTTTAPITTKPTARAITGRLTRRRSTIELVSASPKTSGARTTTSTSSGSAGPVGPKGARPTRMPPISSGIAVDQPRLRQRPAMITAMMIELPTSTASALTTLAQLYSSTGAQVQCRFRSPYALSMRRTGGQYLSRSPAGNTASRRLYG